MKRRKFIKKISLSTTFLTIPGLYNFSSFADKPLNKEGSYDLTRPKKTKSYDIVVYGGTSGGVTAAVQAARMGLSVVLIEPGQHLGGLTSSGLGRTDIGERKTVGGLSREFYERVGKNYGKTLQLTFEPHVAEKVFDEMVEEAGVEVVRGERLDRSAGGIRKEKGKITAIKMESGKTITGKVFIDATYVGDLMAAAGVSYTVGRESSDKYDESLAGTLNSEQYVREDIDPYIKRGQPSSGLLPGIQGKGLPEAGLGDNKVQAYNYRLCLTKRNDNKINITKPEGYQAGDYELVARDIEKLLKKQKDISLNDFMIISSMPGGKTDINNWGYSAMSTDYIGGNYGYPEGSYEQRRRIEEEHKRHIQGLFWFLGHDERVPESLRSEMRAWGYAKDEFTDNGYWPYELYVREARRMEGEYVMTQANCEGKRNVKESVALGSYNMDSHTVRRYVNEDGYMRKDGFFIKSSEIYPISYYAITPKQEECENLLVPVCLSASHVAFGSIRMEPVFMMLGQSAAAAAALCIDRETSVQELPYSDLKTTLNKYNQILNKPE